jgi:hypothetical protein
MYQPASILEEIMLVRRMQGIEFEDITDDELLNARIPPIPEASRPAIMLGEGIFRAGRLYVPRYPSSKSLIEFKDLAVNLVTGNVSLQTSTGKAREKELHYISITCWTTSARVARAPYPPVGGAVQSVIVRRRDFDPKANPGDILTTDTILWQANANINSQALGFSDLLVQFSPPIKIPFYSEVRLEIIGTTAGYPVADSYIGMEVG